MDCMVLPSLNDEAAKAKFPKGFKTTEVHQNCKKKLLPPFKLTNLKLTNENEAPGCEEGSINKEDNWSC